MQLNSIYQHRQQHHHQQQQQHYPKVTSSLNKQSHATHRRLKTTIIPSSLNTIESNLSNHIGSNYNNQHQFRNSQQYQSINHQNTHKSQRNYKHHKRSNSINNNSALIANKKSTPSVMAIFDQAKQLYDKSSFCQAIKYLQEYLTFQTHDTEALYLSAVCYMHLEMHTQAILKLQNIPYSQRNGQNMLLLLAMAYEKAGKLARSFEIINQCLTRFPLFHQGLCYRSKLYLKSQKYTLAQKDLLDSLKLNQSSFICKVALGDCYLEQQKHELALKMYQDSLYIIRKKGQKVNGQHANNIFDVFLKQGICYFQLEQYHKVIQTLQQVTSKERNSDIFYYLGMSYKRLDRKNQAILNLEYCIRDESNKILMEKAFKTLIQHFFQQSQFYQTINIIKIADIANIQCQHWKSLVESCVLVIKGHFKEGLRRINETYQILRDKRTASGHKEYYLKKQKAAAETVNKADKKYDNQFLSNTSSPKVENLKTLKISQQKPTIFDDEKGSRVSRGSSSLSKIKNASLSSHNNNNRIRFISHRTVFPSQTTPSRKLFSSKNKNNKSMFKTVSSIDEQKKPSRNNFLKVKNVISSPAATTKSNANTKMMNQSKKIVEKPIFSDEQSLFLMPILLKFKAYCQCLQNKYLRSLDTYEEYESFMLNFYGKNVSDQIQYNRLICQGYLLSETEMLQESIGKFEKTIEMISEMSNGKVFVEAVLCKIAILLKMVLPEFFHQDCETNYALKNFQRIIDLNNEFNEQLNKHHLCHYYLAFMYILSEKYEDSQESLEQTLKIAEQCSWKYLFLKGIVELILGNYQTAVKEFTAGLILQQNSELYLGRSISFLLQATRRKRNQGLTCPTSSSKNIRKSIDIINNKSNLSSNKHIFQNQNLNQDTAAIKSIKKFGSDISSDVYFQNSFQDLQKFIEKETDQEKISIWVAKLLFYYGAYEQSKKALDKVENKTQQLLEIELWILIYQGQFEDCGQIGELFVSALQGKLIQKEMEQNIMNVLDLKTLRVLDQFGIQQSYSKWLIVLHLCRRQNYKVLIKFLQKMLFEAKRQEELIQIKYNLGIVYFILGEKKRAVSIFQSLLNQSSIAAKNQSFREKIKKIASLNFQQDQCIPDLSQELQSGQVYRLSNFLPFNRVVLSDQKVSKVFFKYSIPFPEFPKPSVLLKINETFLSNQLSINNIGKKLDAPWIKKNKQKIQFTTQIIEAYTNFLKETEQLTNKKSLLQNQQYSNNQDQQYSNIYHQQQQN